jgi:pimeloyl-ACP methyl ester carboxylesterase
MGSFPPDIRTVQVNGTTLHYHERGAGEPVIFVHGTSQDMRTWRAQVGPLSQQYRAVAYSRRYSRPGDDIPPGQDDPMQPHVGDLLEFMRQIDAAPAHLVGNSWGGFISLLAAIREPAMVRTLTLCEPPVLTLLVDNTPRPAQILRLLVRRPADARRLVRFGLGAVEPTKKAYAAGDFEKANRVFGTALLGKKHFEALPPDTREMLEQNQAVEKAQILGEGFPALDPNDVRGVRAATLLITGDASAPLLRITLTGELQRLLPNTQRVTIPGAAHLMHEDNPQAFNHALLSFLRSDAGASD